MILSDTSGPIPLAGSAASTEATAARTAGSLVCPFCGLGCDDLSPPRSTTDAPDTHGCARAVSGYAAALAAPTTAEARIDGEPVSLQAALEHAARLLAQARLPLFSGLLGDLGESRALWRLAERCGATMDHAGGEALNTTLAVVQQQGWITTSLGEARNRADLWLVMGDAVFARQPRLAERLLRPQDRLHADQTAELLVLSRPDATAVPLEAERLDVVPEQVRNFIGCVRAHLAGLPMDPAVHPGAAALAARLRAARYVVVAVDPADLIDPPGASLEASLGDLTLHGLAQLVRSLNEAGRAAILPLGGGDGLSSCQQAGLWHNGFGLRTSEASGVPVYDPHGHATARALAEGGVDLLLWHTSLRPEPPPETTVPTLVFGHPGLRLAHEPAVFVPLGIPGIHRSGQIHRGDGMAVLPLPALRPGDLPAGPDVYTRLRTLLQEALQC